MWIYDLRIWMNMKSLCYSSACIFSDVFCNQKFKNMFGCTKQTLDKLQRVLNSSARVIFGGDSRHHVTPLLRDHLHWLRARERISFKLCLLVYTCTRQSTACHHVISTNCAIQFPLFPTFLLSVPLLVVIWSYPEQSYINSATVHFLWLVRSPGTVCHWTFVCHRHYQRSKTCSRHNSDLISRSYFTD